MDATKVTSSPLITTPAARPPTRLVVEPPDRSSPVPAESKVIQTRTWTYRRDAEALLSAVPDAAWQDPAAQGWTRVKHNARREVFRAEIHGHTYYLKYYFTGRWRRWLTGLFRPDACVQEWAGGMFALQHDIAAIRPVAYTRTLRRAGRLAALLITEAIEPTQPLDDFWRQLRSDSDSTRRRADTNQLMDKLGRLIARAHQAGFQHLDMHAANILVQRVAPRVYEPCFVDLQSARRDVALTDAAVVRNLAQLNQWFRKHSTIGDRLRFLRAYLRWRNEFEHAYNHGRLLGLSFDQLVRALATMARHHAQRLGRQRDHRLGKNGRYFQRVRLSGGWHGAVMIRCKHPTSESRASALVFDRRWWQQQFRTPLSWFAETDDDTQVCKQSHSAMVRRAVLPHADGPVPAIIKRPLARSWRRALAQSLPPGRARRGWHLGHALLHRDVPTARPLAVLQRRIGPFVLDSILITEALPGALDLESFLIREYEARSPRQWRGLKRALLPLLVRHIRTLLDNGFIHRDCKASNVLVAPQPELKLLWIDMDGLRYTGRPASLRQRLRPLVRLHVSLLTIPGLTRTDRVRFLKLYLARFGAAPTQWRKLWPRLEAAAQKKVHRVAKRRAWKQTHYGRK
jgi:hypothetical protein